MGLLGILNRILRPFGWYIRRSAVAQQQYSIEYMYIFVHYDKRLARVGTTTHGYIR